jgi:myo-inositol 2-dehydrogenase/D-chiro-inositol 1-dehydrogenase
MSEARKAKIGFIGAGGFATSKMYPNLHLCPQIDLVSICDIDKAKAELNARNFGAKAVYTDIDEMLDKEELDGVFCIGSGPQQYELSPKVLTRGIPVYVEKPSANKSSEAKELAELAEANNTWGQVGFMKRFAHVYKMAKEIMAREEFGETSMVKTQFTQGPYPQLWGIDTAKRSFLIGQIVHICDLSRYFGGEVESVSALYHEVTETNFAYVASVKYKSGAIGTFDWNAVGAKNFRDIIEVLEVNGFETNLVCRDMMHVEWTPREDWSDVDASHGRYLKTFTPGWAGMTSDRMFGYTGEVAHFALKCIGQAEGGPDLWDCYHALKIGEAVYDSAHSGQTVTITDE